MKTNRWICLGLAVLMLTGCASRTTHHARPISFLEAGHVGGNQVVITMRDGSVVQTLHQETRPDGLVTTDGLYLYTDIDRYVWGGGVEAKSHSAPVKPGATITLQLTNGESKRTIYRGATADAILTDVGEFASADIEEISWVNLKGGELAASIGFAYIATVMVVAWLVRRAFENAFDQHHDN